MLILAVHSSSPTLGLAVVRNGSLLAETTVLANHQHLEHTAPAVLELMSALGMGLRSLDGFGVALGPGSFSGTRVGLATVKGMALALDKPVAGICSLEIPAYEMLQEGQTGLALLDAKRGQLFAATYMRKEDDILTVTPPALWSIDDVERKINEVSGVIVLWTDKDMPPPEPIADMIKLRAGIPSAVTCGFLAEKRLERGLYDNLHLLKPIYVRRPDAEEKPRRPLKPNS